MTKSTGTPALEPARFPTNCRGCGAPIAAGEPALPRAHRGADLRHLRTGRDPPAARRPQPTRGRMSPRGRLDRPARARIEEWRRAAMVDLHSRPLSGRTRVYPPEPAAPFWRDQDGSRHSYGTLRCGLDPSEASALRAAHLAAIHTIAAAALAAAQRGDSRETRRLAAAAGRLCGEIAGFWPPAAVELPER